MTLARISRMALLFAALPLTALAQPKPEQPAPAAPPPPVVSPEVRADNTVTFRFRDPNAQQVQVSLEGQREPLPMQKDAEGVWSVTSAPLTPDYYGYSFVADGVSLADPANPLLKVNLLSPGNMVHVKGPAPSPWDETDVPHGTLHHHYYRSSAVGDQRDYYVYTPPNYDPRAKATYPVLYLLHGFSDDASGWSAVGRANFIFDNLLAQGKIRPMLVVMTLGYGAPEILKSGFAAFRDPGLVQRNITRYGDALLNEVIPQVEKAYRASSDRKSRAIAGLSMGGAESLFVGLNHLDRFAWIGAFSSGGLPDNYEAAFPSLSEKSNSDINLLWIACGTEDFLIDPNRKFRAWLKSRNVKHTDIETPGAHTWMVWRRNLAEFTPLLFGGAKP